MTIIGYSWVYMRKAIKHSRTDKVILYTKTNICLRYIVNDQFVIPQTSLTSVYQTVK